MSSERDWRWCPGREPLSDFERWREFRSGERKLLLDVEVEGLDGSGWPKLK